jgi:hypothetical protein
MDATVIHSADCSYESCFLENGFNFESHDDFLEERYIHESVSFCNVSTYV